MTGDFRIEKLSNRHALQDFDCGVSELNRFLERYAMPSQLSGSSQTYLALSEERVVGYYSLVVGSVEYEDASARLKKGLARHPIPVMLLARLAIATAWQGKGLGSGLLKDAMLRTLQAADIAGIRAFAVHAKDDAARKFYEHFGFEASATDAFHLFRLIKDLRVFLGSRK